MRAASRYYRSLITPMTSYGGPSMVVEMVPSLIVLETSARRGHVSGDGCSANAQGLCAETSCMEALKLDALNAAFSVAFETACHGSASDATAAAANAAYARALQSTSDVEGLAAAIAATTNAGCDCGAWQAEWSAQTAARNVARVAQDCLEDGGGTAAVSVLHTSVDD
jgi:hypothetical protein